MIDGCGYLFDDSGWVVRFCVDVKRLVKLSVISR